MSEHPETPQGPVDPHGEGGIDAPSPPGGPQRTDAPAGSETSSATDDEPGQADQADQADQAGHIAEPVNEADPSPHRDELQGENAETSLDQPSG